VPRLKSVLCLWPGKLLCAIWLLGEETLFAGQERRGFGSREGQRRRENERKSERGREEKLCAE